MTVAALAGCAPPGPSLSITDFRLGPAPPDAQVRAAYMTVHNAGTQARTLVSATSNAFEIGEFHQTQVVNEMSTMRREPSVVVEPGQTVNFEPFGRHLMLMVPVARTTGALTVTICLDDGECVELSEHAP